jgi:serine phosphatase RsbU (regulator of sigma subunit)
MTLFLSGTVADRPRVWPLDQPVVGIGRSSRNLVHLPDSSVSREHAVLELREGRYFLRDLGSRNGTRLNGEEAREPVAVSGGDRIEAGAFTLHVTFGEPPSEHTRLHDATVVGSSLRWRADELLKRRAEQVASRGGTPVVHWLAEAGQLLVVPRPLRETCDELLAIVARAVPASRYVLLLQESPEAEPLPIASRHSGGRADRPLALSRTILGQVLESCAAVFTRDPALDPRFQGQQSIISLGVQSAMAVPLFDNQRVLGVLYVDSQDPLITFDDSHLEVLTLLANMTAVKITNARLLEAEHDRLRLAQELSTATQIQRGMLPAALPDLPDWEFEGFLESCHEVGGDLYDVHVRPDRKVVLIVGDISGKGIGAALLMSSVLSSARVLYNVCTEVTELARRLHEVVRRAGSENRFMTAFLGCLDLETGTLHYVNAGHPAARLVSGGEVRMLETGGIPFGVLDGFDYEIGETSIGPGELLAIFTDGIPEAQSGKDFFDEERLDSTLVDKGALPRLADLREDLLGQVDEFLGGEHRTDDVTLLLVRRGGTPGRSTGSAGR